MIVSESRHALQKSLHHHNTFKLEVRCVWPDSDVHWIVATGRVIPSGRQARVGVWRGVAIDITDRKQAEALAAESVARFQRLADALPEKIFTATPDGETDYLNQQWVDLHGPPAA